MGNKMRKTIAIALLLVMSVCLLTGCGSKGSKFAVEPFKMEWGLTQTEAQGLLKCVYLTNEKSENTIYVMGADNEGMQAFGTTPKVMIYSFNLVKKDSNEPRLGKITISFPSEDYDKVLVYLEGKLGKSAFDVAQWGTDDTDIYLFEDGIIHIEYSSSPIVDPQKVDESTRDRYIALSGMSFASKNKTVELDLSSFYLLWGYSTAETDFVKTDNTK